MLYYLWVLEKLEGVFKVTNIFKYISFRAACATTSAFLLTVIFAPRLISYLNSKHINEDTTKSDSEELNERHRNKKDTPTMGGIVLIFSTLVCSLVFARIDVPFVPLVLVTMILFGGIGFLDDYIKLHTNKKGIEGKTKLLLQCLVAVVVVIALQAQLSEPNAVVPPQPKTERAYPVGADGMAGYENEKVPPPTSLFLPFFKELYIPLGIFFVLFGLLVIVGSSNAVNLTDGLDGLAAGCSVFVCGTFALLSYVVGRSDFTQYLNIPYVPGAGELTVVCASLTGASLGFLWFNCYPAALFMGDTGSLALGAAIGTVAIVIRQELLLLLAGGIFAFEAISVILQVVSFKLTGKRIFRIAPFHHHLEFGCRHENRVTIRMWIVAAFLALFTLSTLKLR